jgi:hypothetical protein
MHQGGGRGTASVSGRNGARRGGSRARSGRSRTPRRRPPPPRRLTPPGHSPPPRLRGDVRGRPDRLHRRGTTSVRLSRSCARAPAWGASSGTGGARGLRVTCQCCRRRLSLPRRSCRRPPRPRRRPSRCRSPRRRLRSCGCSSRPRSSRRPTRRPRSRRRRSLPCSCPSTRRPRRHHRWPPRRRPPGRTRARWPRQQHGGNPHHANRLPHGALLS